MASAAAWSAAVATTTLTNCTVSGNSAGMGGGLANTFYGAVTLTNCIITTTRPWASTGRQRAAAS